MRITPGTLADGREILFFDRAETLRVVEDRRDIEPVRTRSEIRYDSLADQWVAVTAHRQGRTHLPPADECPRCPSVGDRLTEIPEPDWGRCEVVCFTSAHTGSFADLPHDHARLVVDAWAQRTEALSALDEVEQVFCFENRGPEIGVTLHHPHGQIYAYPFVTPTTAQMLRSARSYAERVGTNLFGDLLAAELRAQTRVVWQSRHWAAFVPFAARWPVEVHLYPRRQVPDLAALDDAERDDLAETYLTRLRGLDALFGVPLPYIAAWYQAPVRHDRDLAWLHLRVFSIRRAPEKLKYLAGSESAMGAFINDIAPEDMAGRLQDVMGGTPLVTVEAADEGTS